jgi:hypothetical protein
VTQALGKSGIGPSRSIAAPCGPSALGIGSSNTLPDRPEIRGMIARVPHLIIRSVDEQETPS